MNLPPKTHLTYAEQITKIKDRGLIFENEQDVLEILRHIGYYSFTGYAYPFRAIHGEIYADASGDTDKFFQGAHFSDVMELIQFDLEINSILNDLLSIFEKSLGAQLAYVTGVLDPVFYLDKRNLSKKASAGAHEKWLKKFNETLHSQRHTDFVKHHFAKYQGKLPIWVAIEVMQFGSLTYLYSLLTHSHQREISEKFGLDNTALFEDSLENLRILRNMSAHNSRIWNSKFKRNFPNLSEYWIIEDDLKHAFFTAKNRLYWRIVILVFLTIDNVLAADAIKKLKVILFNMPQIEGIPILSEMGFPENWRNLEFWKKI